MSKYILIALIFIGGCLSTTETELAFNGSILKDEMNESVIDGFFDGDTTGISKDIYLLK